MDRVIEHGIIEARRLEFLDERMQGEQGAQQREGEVHLGFGEFGHGSMSFPLAVSRDEQEVGDPFLVTRNRKRRFG